MRIDGLGLIDRAAPLPFRFDGREYTGFRGDTLASALLANGVRLVGRSFKYHRPRGVWGAGSDEPNALVTVGRGDMRVPNTRATVQELCAGLEARSQNAWPSLRFDAMSINDLAAPFLGAGFYYKTFMWPRTFWERVYEPLIRRAAGLGALDVQPGDAPCEKAFASCDLLVVGAGPAGLMAALVAARSGADVVLCDEGARPGGDLLSSGQIIGGAPAQEWVGAVLAELQALANVRIMMRTTVTGAYDGGVYGALERVAAHLDAPAPELPRETFWRITARRTILAAGALERGIAFPDNDRPGVMSAAAIGTYLNRYGVAPGRSVALFTNNSSVYRVAADLTRAGIEVTVIDARPGAATRRAFHVIAGGRVVGTHGRRGLYGLTVETQSGRRAVRCDALGVSGGWNPAVHLTCHMGGRPVWDAALQAFVPPEDGVPGLTPAGACAGQMTTAACLQDGARAAAQAVADLGGAQPRVAVPDAQPQSYEISPLWVVPGRGRAWLDLQNDVTVKDVRQSAREGYAAAEHMKRYTTQGMATDQGKGSNVGALAVLADATGRTLPETGTTTFRPPYTPVSIAAMGAGGQGKGFQPQRFTPLHAVSVARGATMIEAGLWYRPGFYPRADETTWRAACDREVRHVRQAAGVCDVSTLGKIDVQGPDAAAFLDFVYAGRMSSLADGRMRYGVMLREDGHVMDDGTVARFAQGHFRVTTTTAAAAAVMQHLEFVVQVLRPDLDVRLALLTECFAQIAVAGPQARAVLGAVLADTPVLPFMAHAPVSVGGWPGHLFRISFSGELGYELAVPAGLGAAVFDALAHAAEGQGGAVYGVEALNVMRLEKGFLTHAEIDGRVTLHDLGMQRMLDSPGDAIGKVMARRPGLTDPARPRLVGLRHGGGAGRLTGGAHLFARDARLCPAQDAGHISSAVYSPTCGCDIALAFLSHGPERLGETVRVVDRMRGIETFAEVCAPVFYDPDGGRLRG